MPTVNKAFTITITPEQFVNSCDMDELQELEIEIHRKKKRAYIEQLADKGELNNQWKNRRK